ncbi:MAG: hypothetical protein DI629_04665 [Mesorhizobium amorphae]|nr:MAG: hypothetical protein DI629_04665 [Mesorhizobium amorphae]
MADTGGWRNMASAPKDGTRILATVRNAEQGGPEVDVVFWARADHTNPEGWRATDSTAGAVIAYADPELACWMPLPSADAGMAGAALPKAYRGEEIEVDGSGI